MNDLTTFQQFAAALIGVLSVARTARLIVWDKFPPTIWFRIKWDNLTDGSSWNTLFHCQFCLTPYLGAGMLGWALASGLGFHDFWGLTWWMVNGVWAGSYLAATYVAWDQED